MNDEARDHRGPPVHPLNGNGAAQRSSDLLRHLALALTRHVRELRHVGAQVPGEVEELAALLVHFVRSRQDATAMDGYLRATHDADVADRLLVTKREAAERLGVSERTVDRLVASGRLPLVHVERAARLRVSDLEAYVRSLPEGLASRSDAGESK